MATMSPPFGAGVRRRYLTIETRLATRNYLITKVVLPPNMDAERSFLIIEIRLTMRNYLIANVVLPLSIDAERSCVTIETLRATCDDVL